MHSPWVLGSDCEVVPKDSPVFKNRGKHKQIPRYPSGPIFLNPLMYWALVDVVTDSLIGPVHSLIAQKNSLLITRECFGDESLSPWHGGGCPSSPGAEKAGIR